MKRVAFLPAVLLLISGLGHAQPPPPVDGLLPDSGGSGIPTVTVPASTPGGALEAMRALPADYSDGILSVAARSGNPDPRAWTVTARQNQDLSTLHRFVISGDNIISENLSMNPAEAWKGSIYLNPDGIQVDSRSAWQIAQKQAEASGRTLGSVDYALVLPRKHANPTWILTGHDAKGSEIGKITIDALTGAVLEGF